MFSSWFCAQKYIFITSTALKLCNITEAIMTWYFVWRLILVWVKGRWTSFCGMRNGFWWFYPISRVLNRGGWGHFLCLAVRYARPYMGCFWEISVLFKISTRWVPFFNKISEFFPQGGSLFWRKFLSLSSKMEPICKKFSVFLPPAVFQKQREVLFWGPSPSPHMFALYLGWYSSWLFETWHV